MAKKTKKLNENSKKNTPIALLSTLILGSVLIPLLVLSSDLTRRIDLYALAVPLSLLFSGGLLTIIWHKIEARRLREGAQYFITALVWISFGVSAVRPWISDNVFGSVITFCLLGGLLLNAILAVNWTLKNSKRNIVVLTSLVSFAIALPVLYSLYRQQNGLSLSAKKLVSRQTSSDLENDRTELKLPSSSTSKKDERKSLALPASRGRIPIIASKPSKTPPPVFTRTALLRTKQVDSGHKKLMKQHENYSPEVNEEESKERLKNSTNHKKETVQVEKKIATIKSDILLKNKRSESQRKLTKWDYGTLRGPDRWSRLHSDFKLCATGKEQSPVDIPDRWDFSDHIRIFSRPSPFTIFDDGRAIEVSLIQTSQTYFNEVNYGLERIVFRAPSEHRYQGKVFPMEVQFYHKARSGDQLAIAALVMPGRENQAVKRILAKLPHRPGSLMSSGREMINTEDLLPANFESFFYMGSQTTPPCKENVRWHVMNNPIELSNDQIAIFKTKYLNNTRPVKPLFHR